MSQFPGPASKRAFYGSFTQLGNMIEIGLAALPLLVVTTVVGVDAYREGGWRLPFLFSGVSGVLMVMGIVVRTRISETADFLAQRKSSIVRCSARTQLATLLHRSWRPLLGITLMWASPAAALYVVMTGLLAYTKSYVLELDPVTVQIGLVIGACELIGVVYGAAGVAARVPIGDVPVEICPAGPIAGQQETASEQCSTWSR